MITQQVLDFIKLQLEKGKRQEEILVSLVENGWPDHLVHKAIGMIHKSHPHLKKNHIDLLPGTYALLKETLSILRSRFWTFVGLALIPVIGALVLTFVAIHTMRSVLLYTWAWPAIIASLILYGFMTFLLQGFAIAALNYAALKERATFTESIKMGLKNTWAASWILVLLIFINFGSVFLLIVPIVSIWLTFSLFILIDENTKGMNALAKSKEYVRGGWWPVFGRIFTLVLLIIPLSLSTSLLTMIPKIGWILQSIISLVFGLIFPIYLTAIYKKIKSIKGHVTPAPKTKSKLIAIGTIGILIPVLLIVAAKSSDPTFVEMLVFYMMHPTYLLSDLLRGY